MESDLAGPVILAISTILGAVIGAVLSRYPVFDRLLMGSKWIRIAGKWDSTWIDLDDTTNTEQRELLEIKDQKGSRVSGAITKADEPDKKWDFDGNFSGRFLQITYYPSPDASDKLFQDYGCYFFELRGDGSFEGYSVGFEWDKNVIIVSRHRLRRS